MARPRNGNIAAPRKITRFGAFQTISFNGWQRAPGMIKASTGVLW